MTTAVVPPARHELASLHACPPRHVMWTSFSLPVTGSDAGELTVASVVEIAGFDAVSLHTIGGVADDIGCGCHWGTSIKIRLANSTSPIPSRTATRSGVKGYRSSRSGRKSRGSGSKLVE